jgi:hypothetical protein
MNTPKEIALKSGAAGGDASLERFCASDMLDGPNCNMRDISRLRD